MMYYEIAFDSIGNRGHIVSEEELFDLIIERGKTSSIYASVFPYTSDILNFQAERGNIKDYYGKRILKDFIVDVDKGDDTDEYCLRKVRSLVQKLEETGVDEDSCTVYFSGTGYHVHIDGRVFGEIEPEINIPEKTKATAQKLFKNIDFSVYHRRSLIRVVGTINQKSKLYKIPLTHYELSVLSPKDIRLMSQTQRLDVKTIEGNDQLKKYWVNEPPKIEPLKGAAEPLTIVPCIQKIYNNGAMEGTRNNSMLRIASHARRSGIPSTACKAMLHEWNNGQLKREYINDKVDYIYKKGYMYGCNDWLLKEHCNPRCIFYKRKDYMVDVKTSTDMQKSLVDRMTSDFSGRVLQLGKSFGLDTNPKVYPGDMLTMFGGTGCNKTALAQGISLGYNALTDSIDEELQIPTLFLSLELADWYVHRRNLQIVNDISKEDVERKAIKGQLDKVYNDSKHLLKHMVVQTIPPTMDQIREKVREIQPKLVVVDYVELIEPPQGIRGEYEQIKHACQALRSLAVNQDIVVIMLSQVSREMSRSEALDLYAGKGSGAIENSSSHVLAINGSNKTKKRKLEMLKSTDGELFEKDLFWTPSFRIKSGEYLRGENAK